jgi:hypothetical protein
MKHQSDLEYKDESEFIHSSQHHDFLPDSHLNNSPANRKRLSFYHFLSIEVAESRAVVNALQAAP